MGILISLLVLSFLVFFHELGHFLAARAFGVKVEVFSIGFGKKLIRRRYGDTEYTISAIPLGGYVKMKGQDDFDPLLRNPDADSYNSKPPLHRIAILIAGPLFNILLAFLLYMGAWMIGENTFTAKVGKVSPDSPAAVAGLMAGDTIVAIDSEPVEFWYELSEQINAKKEGDILMSVKRNGAILNITVKPRYINERNIFGETAGRRIIGISISNEKKLLSYGFFEAGEEAAKDTYRASSFILKSIKKLLDGTVAAENIGGVVSVVQVTSEASHGGIVTLMLLTAIISVNLGIVNILPIPALDGGHIIFNLYELVVRKAPSEKAFMRLTIAGWGFLIALTLFGLYNDINRLAGTGSFGG